MTTTSTEDILDMLRESVCDCVTRERDLPAFRARMGRSPGYDERLAVRVQAMGWHSALITEACGGQGMGLREAAVIAEELGRGLMGDVYVATCVLPAVLLQDRAARPAASSWLRRLASGEARMALAWQEQPHGTEPHEIQAEALPHHGGYLLSGRKRWVAGGPAATVFLVTARVSGGVGVFAVPLETAGVNTLDAWQVDGQCLPTLQLEQVVLPADALVLLDDSQAGAVLRALDAGRIVASAELLGISMSAFEMTLDYLKTRVQYDKVIGSFQALQHKVVDLLVQRELAAAVVEEATLAWDASDAGRDLALLASRCKARCSDAALRITRECIQLHGAIGYTHEYDLGLYVKRAMALSAWLGNASQNRHRYANRNTNSKETT